METNTKITIEARPQWGLKRGKGHRCHIQHLIKFHEQRLTCNTHDMMEFVQKVLSGFDSVIVYHYLNILKLSSNPNGNCL